MLTGEHVVLRPLEPGDADTFHRWHNDRDVVRWLAFDYDESLAQIRARFAERQVNTYSKVVLGVETRVTRQLIGAATLRDATPETARAEVDFYLGEKDQWGRGYGTDAMRTLCRYGFDAMRLHSIALWVVADNDAAVRVYEKVGFRHDGRHRDAFRGQGRWHDMILMSLLEGELR
ncbi:GNAT family N-acetyltransferase [Saccharomonospora piscinae]|uniref:GNAT family N-acetyltransferase n=1 Tax=Saccharomonospora piscinae TaxID=687388 RepID=UPI001106DF13|nr:GNAT family protein [Saccharomonospora piscinae]TLW93272.1 GNAT family N-acetyltransferase [Saccharomonospora piscinae]